MRESIISAIIAGIISGLVVLFVEYTIFQRRSNSSNQFPSSKDYTKLIGLVLTILTTLFGNNIFQQVTGYSIYAAFFGSTTPTAAVDNPLERVKIQSVANARPIADYYDEWSSNDKGYIQKIYCYQYLRLANPTDNATTIIDFSTNILFNSEKIEFYGQGTSSISADAPNGLPFSHIESSLVGPKITNTLMFPLPYSSPDPSEPTPEFLLVENIPTATPNPDITSTATYRVSGEILSLPLRMENATIVDANILTVFSVDYYSYEMIPDPLEGFNSVVIQNVLITITGQKIYVSELPCYYAKSK